MIRGLKYEYSVEGELSLMSTREIYVNIIKQSSITLFRSKLMMW